MLNFQAKRLQELELQIVQNSLETECEKDTTETEKDNQDSFHEQITKITEEFQQEKEKLLEEQRKLKDEAHRQLEEKERAILEMKSNTIDKSAFEEDFTCTICQELILTATTLECSHSFCKYCISNWLDRKRQCPVCREQIVKSPIRSLTLDNAIAKVVTLLPEQERVNWEDRVLAQIKQTEEDSILVKLQELISLAKSRNLKFLSIFDNWTPEEKKIFQDGVGKYKGKARTLYCQTTGLLRILLRMVLL